MENDLSRYSWNTFIIHAASSSGSRNPSALVQGSIPLTSGFSIEEAGTQAAYIKIVVEHAEVFQGHPVDIRD